VGKVLILLLCALLAGASGLGLEVLGTHLAGLTLGYGQAGPLAITIFIAGWAAGARLASAWNSGLPQRFLGMGLWLCLWGAFMPYGFSLLARSTLGVVPAGLGSVVLLLGIALPQGMFLPLLARGLGRERSRDLSLLFAMNLAGGALGAWSFGSVLPASKGRTMACLAAAACALGAGLLAAWVSRQTAADENDVPSGSGPSIYLGLVVAAVTAWAAILEWFGLRLAVLWLGGMQDSLGAVLVATMVALALGAALLPRILPKGRVGLCLLAILCAFGSLTYFFTPQLMVAVEGEPLYLRSMALIGPALLPFGAWIPMLHRSMQRTDARGLGQLLGYEAFGALIGLPLMHFFALPMWGLGPCILIMAVAALLFAMGAKPRAMGSLGLLVFASLVISQDLHKGDPALDSPPLQNPAFELLSFHEDEHFAVSIVQDGLMGERTLLTDGFRAAANGHEYAYMRALAHLPLLMHPDPKRVGVLAFGTGTTAGALSLHERLVDLEVLELSGTVIENAHWFEAVNRNVLEDPRVHVTLGDGRHTLRQRKATYDVLTMEPLLPDSPFAVYLYTKEFYEQAKRSLAPGGLLCQWVPPHALEPATFDAVLGAFTEAFPWSGIWVFGTQVILLGAEEEPTMDPARFPSPSSELGRALAGLGLHDVAGISARFIMAGEHWPQSPRPLLDLDPWVIYRERRRGSVLLGDLPLNLAKLRAHTSPAPATWQGRPSENTKVRAQALALMRRVREGMEADRALATLSAELKAAPQRSAALETLRAKLEQQTDRSEVNDLLRQVRNLVPQEAALLRFENTLEFEQAIRAGFALLRSGQSESISGNAALKLTRATVLRPERADVHAYLALALQRLDSDRARLEINTALKLCPNLRGTRVGQRLISLGFTWPAE
jgi:spermidine synthase